MFWGQSRTGRGRGSIWYQEELRNELRPPNSALWNPECFSLDDAQNMCKSGFPRLSPVAAVGQVTVRGGAAP